MAAFDQLDWLRLDVCAMLAGNGIAVVEPQHRAGCHAWLSANNYAVSTIDFLEGVDPAVSAMGRLFRWEEQFGYALNQESRNLNALRDGFEFPMQPGRGAVLELLHADVAHRDDPDWFCGLLSIAQEYSLRELALGAKFFTILILPRDSKLLGMPYQQLAIPGPFWTAARGGDPFAT